MNFERVLSMARTRSTHSWRDLTMKHRPLLLALFWLLLGAQSIPSSVLAQTKAPHSNLRHNWKSPVSYGQFHRRSDRLRRGPRRFGVVLSRERS